MRWLFALTFFLIGACSDSRTDFAPITPGDTLIGRWYSGSYQPTIDAEAKSIIQRKSDGTFVITFKWTSSDKTVRTQTEEGIWTHRSGFYTTQTLKVNGEIVDPNEAHYLDQYEITAQMADSISYRSLDVGQEFTARKVANDFRMP